ARIPVNGFASHAATCDGWLRIRPEDALRLRAVRKVCLPGAQRRRQIERECAAVPGNARDFQRAAEQAGELAADRQSEPGPAVLACDARLGLLEGFENDLLFVFGNTDPGIGYGEGHDRIGLVERPR